jgi:hypothetical protein
LFLKLTYSLDNLKIILNINLIISFKKENMPSKNNPSTFLKSYSSLLLLLLVSVGLVSPTQAFAVVKSTPTINIACSANPIAVHSATTCTAIVTGNGTDSLDGDKITFSTSGLGSFVPANKKCTLLGDANSANCSVTYTGSAVGTTTHIIGGTFPSNTKYNSVSTNTVLTVTKTILTVSSITASNKVYDGNTLATVITSSAALSGIFTGEVVTLDSSGVSGLFSDKNVGTSKTVTVFGLAITGADSGNYTLTQPTATADITPKSLAVIATGISKVYDTTTNASVSLSSDKLGGDEVTLSGTASFADANVGTDKAISVIDIAISGGTDASNYALSNTTANATANITQESATIALDKSNLSRIYNKTSQEVLVLSTTPASLSYSLTYNGLTTLPQAVGSYDVVASITDPNYSGSDTATLAITPLSLSMSGVTVSNKIYDNTTDAAVCTSGSTLNNLIEGDDVSFTNTATATFSDKNVGTDKTVTITGVSLTGTDSGNYSLTQPSATATITAKELTVSGVTANKVYDGNATATLDLLSASLVGVIETNEVMLATTSAEGVFADKVATTSKSVNVSGLTITGADSGNYTLTQPLVIADITPRSLTFTAIAENKVYDGTDTASTTLSGDMVSGDDIVASSISSLFADANVGTDKIVTIHGIAIIGADVANYSLSSTTATTSANITTRPVTITADNKSKFYGDTDPSLTSQITSGSLAGDDTVTGSLNRVAGENVGTYDITQGDLTLSSNYDLTFVPGNFVIEIGSSNSSVVMMTTLNEGESSLSATIPTQTNNSANVNGVLVTVSIPAGTVVTGPLTWNGGIDFPTVATSFTSPTADPGFLIDSLLAVEIGAGDTPLTFSRAIRIVFAGQSGKLVGWSRGGVFTKITETCSSDDQESADTLDSGSDCRINSESDLVVWTKHFSSFITYQQVPKPIERSSNGPIFFAGSGGGVIAPRITNSSNTPPPAPTNSTTGGGAIRSLAQFVKQVTVAKNPANSQVSFGGGSGGSIATTSTTTKSLTKKPSLQAAVANTKLPNIFQRIFKWVFRR